MSDVRRKIAFYSNRWHSWLGWTGGLALLLFASSGLLHILMTWTGPQAASFFPPQAEMKAAYVQAIPKILSQNNIDKVIIAKIVPAEAGAVLQVTEVADQPRRYFDLVSGAELPLFDELHAIWLARYYSGHAAVPVRSISFQTEFDESYPWVNRLLPVYRVTFETEDNLTAFIYTELGALASFTNDWKSGVLTLFSVLHTWAWLDDVPKFRIVVMMLFLVSLFGMAATGTAMVFVLKNRQMERKRKWHRMISYGVWLPILLFSSSGMYHLLQGVYDDAPRGLQLGQPFSLTHRSLTGDASWVDLYQGVALNGISLLGGPDNQLLYRLSLPQGRHGEHRGRHARFDGVPIEKAALYFNAADGTEASLTDRDMAIHIANSWIRSEDNTVLGVELVTRFGPDYDFRNKRLPVWRVDYASPSADRLFVDPGSGMLVERIANYQRYESYSFSYLHKWNFLTPLVGRAPRDLVMVLTILAALGGAVLGAIMLIRQTSRRRKKHQ